MPHGTRALADNFPSRNLILSRLSRADQQLLNPHLQRTDLPLRKVLEPRGKRFKRNFFPESGLASVVADGRRPIEVGLIGREGMSGIAIVFGYDTNENETFMQLAGHGLSIGTDKLKAAINKSPTLQRSLLRYAYGFLRQTTRTALANGRGKIEERLARWLLMASDRADGPELPLTHEFLAMMLGVQRPGVTVAIQELERSGVIARRRASIIIIDRPTLEKMSNGTYIAADDQ